MRSSSSITLVSFISLPSLSLPAPSPCQEGSIKQQKKAYEQRVANMMARALDDYRMDKIDKAYRLLDYENDRKQQQEEEEEDRLIKLEHNRLAVEEHDRLTKIRLEAEALAREKEVPLPCS